MKRILFLIVIINLNLFSNTNLIIEKIENNDIEAIRQILRDGENINTYNSENVMSPLMYASKVGNIDIVRELLNFGAKDYEYAFYIACEYGHWNIAKELMQVGEVNLNIALSYASFGGQIEIVNNLIEYGATDINSALVSASEGNHLDIINLLLEKGANINTYRYIQAYRNNKGAERKYPITATTDINIIKELIEKGATNINEALLYNAKNNTNNNDIIFELIDLGADVNYANPLNGTTTLMYMIEKENVKDEDIKKLIEIGANVNSKDRSGNTVLIRALMYNYTKPIDENYSTYKTMYTPLSIIKLLVENGASPNERNSFGNTAKSIASKYKRKDIIEYFDTK